jgi:hypothetical protein
MPLNSDVGSPDSESYVSEAEIRARMGDLNIDDSSFTTAQVEAAARRATTWLDATYMDRFPGSPTNTTQALYWPATGAATVAGAEIDSNVIPKQVKNATIEAVISEVQNPNGLTPTLTTIDEAVKKRKLGQLETEYFSASERTSGGSSSSNGAPQLLSVDFILSPILKAGSRTTSGAMVV